MTTLASLVVLLKGDVSHLAKEMDKAEKLVSDVGGAAEKAQGRIGAAFKSVGGADALGRGLGAIKSGLGDFVQGAAEAEKVGAQLDAVLKSTGGSAGIMRSELDKDAAALQKLTTFDDDAIQGAQALLLTFTDIGKGVFPDVTKAVLDMSTAMGTDLKSSAIQIGKALNDPIKGLTALSRVGVAFTAEQREQIETMAKSGDIMGAQKIILAELNKEFGGSAAAAADTYAGKMQQLQNRLDNTKESMGGFIIEGLNAMPGPLQNVTLLAGQFTPQLSMMAMGLHAIAPAAKGFGTAIQAMSATSVPALRAISLALLTPPLGIIVALAAVGVAAYIFRDDIAKGIGAAKDFVLGAAGEIRNALGQVLAFARNNWPEIATLLAGPFAPIVLLATDAFGIRSALLGALSDAPTLLWDAGSALINGLWGGMQAAAVGLFDWVAGLGKKIADLKGPIDDDQALLVPAGQALMQGLGKGLQQGFQTNVSPMLRWLTASISQLVDLAPSFFKGLFEDELAALQNRFLGLPQDPHLPSPGSVFNRLGRMQGFASGIRYVPSDNFPALLHRGERVMTAEENRRGAMGGEVNINTYGPLTINNASPEEGKQTLSNLGYALAAEFRRRGVPVFS